MRAASASSGEPRSARAIAIREIVESPEESDIARYQSGGVGIAIDAVEAYCGHGVFGCSIENQRQRSE